MHPVVVLDKRGQFYSEVKKFSKIVKWLNSEKVSILAEKGNEQIRGIEVEYPMPLVVMLKTYPDRKNGKIWKVKKENIVYSPHEVFKRDNNQCQYWHYDENGDRYIHQCTELDRTIDHVVPITMCGENSFTNCVCCCRWHNTKIKKNLTLKESGLELIRKPVVPKAKVGEEVVVKFTYNPNKLAHRVYMEQILNKEFSHVVAR